MKKPKQQPTVSVRRTGLIRYVTNTEQDSVANVVSPRKTHLREDMATFRSSLVSLKKLRLLACLIRLWRLVELRK